MPAKKHNASIGHLILGSIGIVFGDIGTSPLYALKSCFSISKLSVNEANILGLISVITWVLLLVVSFKYVSIVLRFSNKGEGGILSLSSLCAKFSGRSQIGKFMISAGIFGAALFFSDGIITPAISVLSSIEGLGLISPHFKKYILPLSVVILALLFLIQKHGTGIIGKYFSIIMTVWFLVIACMGIYNICNSPYILKALNPYYAIKFFINNNMVAFFTLGAVILVVTGAEALYADLGHFGKMPISVSWTFFVMPSLVLNYLGQGGLLLKHPETISNPFYSMVPEYLLYPLIFLATAATILASQSVISGVFSLAWQAIMFDYLPRMKVEHTSDKQIGQVYIPAINYILCFATIAVTVTFGNSERLSVAYGLTVSGTMLVTSLMILYIVVNRLKWSKLKTCIIFVPLICLDIIFVASNITKIIDGAWFTLISTLVIYYIIQTWRKGNAIINSWKYHNSQSLKAFILNYNDKYKERIPGVAIFMTRDINNIPRSLAIHLEHNKYLHDKIVFVSLVTKKIPRIQFKNRFMLEEISHNTFSIISEYGFQEKVDLKKLINFMVKNKIIIDDDYSFYLNKGEAIATDKSSLNKISQKIYIFLSRISLSAYEFYEIPIKNTMILGIRYLI